MQHRFTRLLTLLLTLAAAPLWLRAQAPDGLHQQLDQVLAPLDRSQVPTGRLLDYAHPFAPLAYFDGISLADSTRTSPTLWRALYAAAYSACLTSPNPLPTLPAVNQRVRTAEAGSPRVIPLLVERLDYAALRPDAFSANLLSFQNGQVADVPGRSQSPYQVQTLFAATASYEAVPSGNVSFVFTRPLHLQSGGGSVRSLALDLGDGQGYRPAAWNVPVAAAYPAAGTYRLKVRVTYNGAAPTENGRYSDAIIPPVTCYSQFDLYVERPAAAAARTQGGATLANDSIAFTAQPGRAAGKAYIRYAQGHTSLVKPLIVVEGYDKHFIAPHIALTNYSLDLFLEEIKTTGFNFRDALENVGQYDIVFIDFANGTDDILLNAGLFKAVLDEVNVRKGPNPTEDNVVMGMSMGGLIARYKLAEMEQATPGSTHTRLLVLQDSPQRGANVPLGIQAVVRQAQSIALGNNTSPADIDVRLAEAIALLDQPGTRQLLLYVATTKPHDGTTAVDMVTNTFLDNVYRPKISFPEPYRVVAVSQGAQCGTELFAPGTELLRGTGHVNLFNLPFIFAGSSGIFGQLLLNALPAYGSTGRVAGLNVQEVTQAFFDLVTVSYDIIRDNYTPPAGLLPLDGVAGSTEGLGDAVGLAAGGGAGNATYKFIWFPYIYYYSIAPKFSFLSTASALDVADYSVSALNARFINDVASYSYSSTKSFLAQNPVGTGSATVYSQPHLTFTARNGEWIFDQMQRNPAAATALACSTECSALTLTGPSQVCAYGPATFQTNAPNATWSVTPASYFTTASGTLTPASGGQFALTAAAGASGIATLTLRVNSCEVATLTIHAGEYIEGYYQVQQTGQSATLQADPYGDNPVSGPGVNVHFPNAGNSGVTYSFSLAPSQHSFYQYSPGDVSLSFYPDASGSYAATLTVTKTSACGSATENYNFYHSPGSPYQVYPNPADNTTTVSQGTEAEARPTAQRGPAAIGATTFTVDVYDSYGQLRQSVPASGPRVQLNTSLLPAGLYSLVITEAGTGAVVRRRLEVTRW